MYIYACIHVHVIICNCCYVVVDRIHTPYYIVVNKLYTYSNITSILDYILYIIIYI